MRHLCSQIQKFLLFSKTLKFEKFKSDDLKYVNTFFKFLPNCTQTIGILVLNIVSFGFTCVFFQFYKFESANMTIAFQISSFCFQISSFLVLHETFHFDKCWSVHFKYENSFLNIGA